MGYCLVVNMNGQLEPVQNFSRRYDAINFGLELMNSKSTYHKYIRFNGITEFQIWTDKIQTIDYDNAKHWYLLGYGDAENKQALKAKDLGIKNASIEYGCYECGVSSSRYKSWKRRYF